MTINCFSCPDYHDGKGVPSCVSCKEQKFWPLKERQGLLGSDKCVRIEKRYLENLTNPEEPLKTIFPLLPLMDERLATVLLQYNLLNMTQVELGIYYGVQRQTIAQWLKKGEAQLRGLL